jgi:hypothetical protein
MYGTVWSVRRIDMRKIMPIELPEPMPGPLRKADECGHTLHMPIFNQEEAKNLSVAEIRRRWPRFFGTCEMCKENVIMYASLEHYVYGDW